MHLRSVVYSLALHFFCARFDHVLAQITIRLLGGLLSAYHLSPFSDRTLYLAHAVDLGNRLLSTYKTPSGIPLSKVNLGQSVGIPDKDNRGLASLAEVASTQLELKYLSEISGDDRYWKAAERVMFAIRDQPSFDGLRPIFIECVCSLFCQRTEC